MKGIANKLLGAVMLLMASMSAQTTPLATAYDIKMLGFPDAEHTRDDGFRVSIIFDTNEAGQVLGNSFRYSGSTFFGASAWLYNGSNTVNIGLTDSGHTREDGYRVSFARQLNMGGLVAGGSDRFTLSTDLGRTAWLYDGSSHMNIGLTDSVHTRNDGYQNNDVREMNEAGQVLGFANRFTGSTDLGQTAWLYNGTSTVNIGLTDINHTRNDGYRFSSANLQNEAGQIAGQSNRYNGSGSHGTTAWLYDGSSYATIGLTDAVHTNPDGAQSGRATHLNEAGQVAGISNNYVGRDSFGFVDPGQSAWLYNGASTVNIGLTDSEHTRSDGKQRSDIRDMNEAGHVTGTSDIKADFAMGKSAWLYNGSSTVNIGLTDAEHTRNDGYRSSFTPGGTALNEAGHTVGFSTRFSGAEDNGRTAWLYDGTSTRTLGFVDSEHTRDDGYQYSGAGVPNEASQVAGYSKRYSGSTDMGQTAWLYDLTLDQISDIVLSVRSDGYAYSTAGYLSDEGLLFGTYKLYDIDDTFLGDHVYAFTLDDGAIDLGLLVSGGLDSKGWDSLASAYLANDFGQIVGQGLLDDGTTGKVPYLLTPVSAVPVPAALWLFGSGLLGLVGIARTKRTLA